MWILGGSAPLFTPHHTPHNKERSSLGSASSRQEWGGHVRIFSRLIIPHIIMSSSRRVINVVGNRLVGASAVLTSSSRQPPRSTMAEFASRRGVGTPPTCRSSRHYYSYYSSVFPSSSCAAETSSLQGIKFINQRYYFQSSSRSWDTQQQQQQHQQQQQQQHRDKSGVAEDSTPPEDDDDDDSSSSPPPVSTEGEADIAATSSSSHSEEEDVAAVPTTTTTVPTTTTTVAKEEDDDSSNCPPWQNPLHHNNPDYQFGGKILAEDYEIGEEMPLIPLPPFESGVDGSSVLASPYLHELADDIVRLSMLEVKELVDRVGEHFGIGDDDDDYSGGGGGGGGGGEAVAAPTVEVKTVFDLRLTGFDEKSKIKVIKEIRTVTSLGLKEAKELVEGAPVSLVHGQHFCCCFVFSGKRAGRREGRGGRERKRILESGVQSRSAS